MKIAIIGAGAMGLLYASKLQKHNDVSLIDKNKVLIDKINKDGFTVKEQDGSTSLYRLPVYFDGSAVGVCDLVIVFVKDTVTKFAVPENVSLTDSHTVVLSLQNGLGNDDVIKQTVDEKQILLGTTKHNSVILGLGEIYHSGSGVTTIGSVSGDHEKAKLICDNFNSCSIETHFSDNVRYSVWEKLFVNMTVNPVSALLDCKIGFLAENPHTVEVMRSLICEAVEVAYADGCAFDKDKIFDDLIRLCKDISSGKASMCQDVENKRKTEIDFINGAVVKLGIKYNIPTPTHSAITKFIHAKELLY